jgi:phosphate:Na+ symporter
MNYDFIDFLQLVGALGFFIYGMKIMSEGIQKVAGEKMRSILGAMTSNRFFGVLTGLFVTLLVQSSSATTVMTVSFVNAGLLSLTQSIGVVMGANIGTTVTSWLISIFGFKFNISSITLPIIAVAFPMLFSSKSVLKSWAEVMIGFALLFMGLDALKQNVPNLQENPEVLEFVTNLTGMGTFSLLIFIALGTALTITVQSSSAAMALTLVMCDKGWIPFEMAAGLVLGENIGTTITANLAAIVANVHAKRTARAHLIFNVFGVLWMIAAFPFFIKTIDWYMYTYHNGSPLTNFAIIPISLSIFHTSFNVLNVLLLVWFVPQIERVVTFLVKSKGDEEEGYHLEYIGAGMMGTPELSILEAKKEVAKFGLITKKMFGFVKELLFEKDQKKAKKLLERINHYEEITDRIEVEVADYLLKISEGELSEKGSLRMRSMLSIVGDLERVGDILYQMSKNFERKIKEKSWFTPDQRENLKEMFDLLDASFEIMMANLNGNYENCSLDKAREIEQRLNKLRNQLRKSHLKSMENGEYNIKSGMIYSDLFSSCEKVGDHLINVSEAVKGEI